MVRTSPVQMRIPRLGCLAQCAWLMFFGLSIVWIFWPAGAQQHWDSTGYRPPYPTSDSPRLHTTVLADGTIAVYFPNNIFLFDTQTFELKQQLPIQAGALYLSPDRSMFAAYPQTVSAYGTVHMYRTTDGALLHALDNPTDESIRGISWSADSRTVAISLTDAANTMYRYWDATTGREVKSPLPRLTDVSDIVYTPDGYNVMISAGDTLIVFRIRDGEEIYRLTLPQSRLVLSPNGAVLLAYEHDNIRAFRAADGVFLWGLGYPESGSKQAYNFLSLSRVVISPDSQYALIGEAQQIPYFIRLSLSSRIGLIRLADGAVLRTYWGHREGITSLAFTPDGKSFISTNSEEVARWALAPLPPWLIWLPIIGICLLVIHAVWQFAERLRQP